MTGSAEKRFLNVSSIVATIDEVEGELFLFSSVTFVLVSSHQLLGCVTA